MKKALYPILAALALTAIAASCKKSDSGGGGSWKVSSNAYTAATATVSASSGSFELLASTGPADDGVHTISFLFNSMPAVSASYRVVKSLSRSADEVRVIATGSTGSSGDLVYCTTGNGNATVAVTVTGNKVAVSMSGAWAANLAKATDSVRLSANAITQQ